MVAQRKGWIFGQAVHNKAAEVRHEHILTSFLWPTWRDFPPGDLFRLEPLSLGDRGPHK
jgi:hypothetical protein